MEYTIYRFSHFAMSNFYTVIHLLATTGDECVSEIVAQFRPSVDWDIGEMLVNRSTQISLQGR
jgi:hypothetical protein